MGNPVRSEIVAVRREVGELRKQIEQLTEENMVYRKYMMELMKKGEDAAVLTSFTRDISMVTNTSQPQQMQQPGGGTVQGGGFRR
jgi:hypothetical protein